jgi:aspartate-semialdehyde dehydrogenase
MESETQKILGSLADEAVRPHPVVVSAHTTRVPVIDGHTMSISAALETQPPMEEVRRAMESFRGRPQELALPSAPEAPIFYHQSADRPQPRLDVERDGGMTITVGRLRPCSLFGYKLVALGHNTVRGAAGAAVLNAELMHRDGWLD